MNVKMSPMLPVANVANPQPLSGIGIGRISTLATFIVGLFLSACAFAEPAYTNHAGNVVSGAVVSLDARTVVVSNEMESVKLPLSIFPEPEKRRIAADFLISQGAEGQVDMLRVPAAVKRAVSGSRKAIARSRKRAEKGLCTKEESDAFCEKSEEALRSYLDRQVESGVITPEERKALRW